MSIGWTVALVIAGIMSGAVLGFCCLALVVSSRRSEERVEREMADRVCRFKHRTEVNEIVHANKAMIDSMLTELQRARHEKEIDRGAG